MKRFSVKRAIASLLLCVILYGCSISQDDETLRPQPLKGSGMKVSVSTNGTPVKNFQDSLVHRIDLTALELARFQNPHTQRLQLPFTAQPERDGRGKTMGVRIPKGSDSKQVAKLGLKPDDLITAVGRKIAHQTEDLSNLFVELRKKKMSSMTVERNGVPHKLLFYLADS